MARTTDPKDYGFVGDMQPITVEQLLGLTDGIICGDVNPTAQIHGCAIDTRSMHSGDAFFALPGSHQHGVDFAEVAVRCGASVVVVDRAVSDRCPVPHVQVGSSLATLSMAARQNRRQSQALVIGVTGSVGKTTTRQMIAAALGTEFTGIQSPRNFNNQLGVPLSLLELQPDDEFAVIEIAASAPGEIRRLAAVAEPEFAVVTRVAPAHLRGFGSLQGVQKEKRTLVESLPTEGVAFLNADDPLVLQMATMSPARVVTFGFGNSADVRATDAVHTEDGFQFLVDGHPYQLHVCGSHNITNALAAIAIGQEIGLTCDQIAAGLNEFRSPAGRCRLTQIGEWQVIDDSYNSSPASMTAAIRALEETAGCHHRVAVVGDMLDLGEQSQDLHYGMGATLAAANIDHVAVLGNFAGDLADGYLDAGGSLNRLSVFSDMNLMVSMLECLLSTDDAVLVKGSRGMQMERVISHLNSLCSHDSTSTLRAA